MCNAGFHICEFHSERGKCWTRVAFLLFMRTKILGSIRGILGQFGLSRSSEVVSIRSLENFFDRPDRPDRTTGERNNHDRPDRP